MTKVYIGLGTNIGNKRGNLIKAAALLAERVGDILALSSVYETEPWGFASENSFLNAALELETDLDPQALLEVTQAIELEMGRNKKSDGQYHDRIIDVDLLMYDNQIIQSSDLILPHPLMHKRSFVMEPLAEIAPNVVHPLLEKTMLELYEELS